VLVEPPHRRPNRAIVTVDQYEVRPFALPHVPRQMQLADLPERQVIQILQR
jgi:hypothetical protein